MKTRLFFLLLFGAFVLNLSSCEDKDDPTKYDPNTDKTTLQAVDLGLTSGLKWATINIGANKAQEVGDYFAWGETQPKKRYDWSTYKWIDSDTDSIIKYFTECYFDLRGNIDQKTILDPKDDAATIYWGEDWHMPTKADWQELIDECYWEWTDNYNNTGIAGCIVTGILTKNSIFLPAGGYRKGIEIDNKHELVIYLSSSLACSPYEMKIMQMQDDYNQGNLYNEAERNIGIPIRPVQGKSNYGTIPADKYCQCDTIPVVGRIYIEQREVMIAIGEQQTCVLRWTPIEADLDLSQVIWTTSNSSVVTVNGEGVIMATGVGEATITAIYKGLIAECEVRVFDKLGVTPTEGAVTVVWNIVETEVCSDLVFAGDYNGYNTDASQMVKFEAIEGHEGWYKAVITPADASLVPVLRGKPCALATDGTFPSSWDYQWINVDDTKKCEIIEGPAELQVEYDVESKLVVNENSSVVYVRSYGFKSNPCVAPSYEDVTFKLKTTVPVTEGGIVYIVGDAFEKSWDVTAYPMEKVDANIWTITLPALIGQEYRYVVNGNWDNDQMQAPEEGAECSKPAGNLKIDFTQMEDEVYGFLNFGVSVMCEE